MPVKGSITVYVPIKVLSAKTRDGALPRQSCAPLSSSATATSNPATSPMLWLPPTGPIPAERCGLAARGPCWCPAASRWPIPCHGLPSPHLRCRSGSCAPAQQHQRGRRALPRPLCAVPHLGISCATSPPSLTIGSALPHFASTAVATSTSLITDSAASAAPFSTILVAFSRSADRHRGA